MLKKLALALFALFFLPFLSSDYRRGFKIGWNQEVERGRALGKPLFKHHPTFNI